MLEIKTTIAAGVFVLSAAQAFAGCELELFDQSEPRALVGDVDNMEAEFTWGSDVDRENEVAWVWNYLENKHVTKPISASWPKADISISYANPLPPGGIFCNKYPVKSIADAEIDYDAPITYGNRNLMQRAALYIVDGGSVNSNAGQHSKISTTYIDTLGVRRELDVTFEYVVEGKELIYMAIFAPDDVYVGVSAVEQIWSDATLASLKAAAFEHDAEAFILPWAAFVPAENLTDQLVEVLKLAGAEAVILKGTIKGFGGGEISDHSALTRVVILDGQRQLITTGLMAIPVTK